MESSPQALILVTGCVPGAGKSSLARGLAAGFGTDGRRVELFREEDILSESAFSHVMHEFDVQDEVQLATLFDGAARYLDSIRERGSDVVVLDALFPFLPSLLAWGYTDDDMATFLDRLATLFEDLTVVEVHVVVNPRVALARAAEREGGDWLESHIAKVSRFKTTRRVATFDDAVAFYRAAATRSQVLMERSPWPVALIEADAGPAITLARAQSAIASRWNSG